MVLYLFHFRKKLTPRQQREEAFPEDTDLLHLKPVFTIIKYYLYTCLYSFVLRERAPRFILKYICKSPLSNTQNNIIQTIVGNNLEMCL